MFYKNGNVEGWYMSFSETGDTTYKAFYVDDIINGPVYYYSEIGELQLVRYYYYGKLTGYSYPHKNGGLVDMIPVKSGTGKVVSYYANGNKSREFNFLNGEFEGEYIKYYNDGSVSDISTYKSGNDHGKNIYFYPSGKIKIVCNYLNDVLHGTFTLYYENGQIAEQYNYLNGTLTGIGKYYKDNGELSKEIYYYNGNVQKIDYY